MNTKKNLGDVKTPALVNVRRRVLPLASAAAAMGLAGCGILGGTQAKDAPAEKAGVQASNENVKVQRSAEEIRKFTEGLDAAIEKMDQSKLNAIAESAGPRAGASKAVVPAKGVVVAPPVAVSEVAGPTLEELRLSLTGVGPVVSATSVLGEGEGIFGMAGSEEAMRGAVEGGFDFMGLTAAEAVEVAPVLPSVEVAMEVIRSKVAARPTLNTALALALLEKAEGRAVDAGALAKDLSATDQKLLADLLGALEGMKEPAKAGTLTERAVPLLDAAKRWQADADLTLPKLALASKVESFGVYDKVDAKFTAGKKHAVIIYCEVANFQPKQTAEGWYETKLSQQETLATEDGLLLWRPNAEEVEDRSKNVRHDFYLVKKLTIPGDLAIGKYALRMSVTDKNSGKIAVVTLPIEIVK
jgi:hypothetical protein